MGSILGRFTNYGRRWIHDWNARQLVLGISVATVFGVMLPYLNIPIVEWMADYIVFADPKLEQLANYQQVGKARWWGALLFLGLYLLPVLLVDTAAGFGREGFLSVVCFGVVWWAVGSSLGFPSIAFIAIFTAIVLELIFNAGMAIYSNTEPGKHMEYGFGNI